MIVKAEKETKIVAGGKKLIRDNHQKHIGYSIITGGKLLFVLKLILVILYSFIKYALVIIPLPLTIANSLGLISEELSQTIAILIYCILIYQISPKILKPLFGDFIDEFRIWIRISIISLTILYYYISDLSDYDYTIILSLATLFLLGILMGMIMRYESDMVQWKGPLPAFCNFLHATTERDKKELEDIKKEYKGDLDAHLTKRILIRILTVCTAGLAFTVVSFFLGFFLDILINFSIIFTMLLLYWLMIECYYLIEKGKKVNKLGYPPEHTIVSSIFTPKIHGFIKWITGALCLMSGFGLAAGFATLVFDASYITRIDFFVFHQDPILGTLALLMFFINGISLILAVIFQLYFWRSLILRFPHFLNLWIEKNMITEVEVPRLAPGGVLIFLVNTIIIIFLCNYIYLWAFFSQRLFLKILIGGIALIFPSLFFLIYLLYSAIKTEKLKDKNHHDLFKDNIRIPFTLFIQLLSFPSLFYIYDNLSFFGVPKSYIFPPLMFEATPLFIFTPCIFTLFFYLYDIDIFIKYKFSKNYLMGEMVYWVIFLIIGAILVLIIWIERTTF